MLVTKILLLNLFAFNVFALNIARNEACGTNMDLKAKYHAYIDTLNSDMPPGSLDQYIKDGVKFNDFKPLSPAECIANVKSVKADLPGLHFAVDWLILEKDQGSQGAQGFANLAVRANISYHPEPGKELAFWEHCFYRFEEGKIARAKSVVDVWGLPEKDQAIARNL
ncbi:hypothetical protein H2200_008741 [Cladophialophora chaetospira]|uniref:SnoaL-like domain-containing protein n=1 Tax=Cladophialophora chaetospira TaxID=386627 RepID=A0AA38X4L4_9EURO|nr:hypothetical protein H2200_008741 [Cladophialophora chaetospira]